MSNSVFPSLIGLSWPVKRTPIWRTKVQESFSGKETRIGFWSYPQWEYDISYGVLRSLDINTELQQLLGFFNSRMGAFDDWLFNDLYDNMADAQVFGVGNGSQTVFQLARSLGGYVEPVRAVSAVSQVRISGTPTAAYTLDQFKGLITFSTAPTNGAVLDWTGTYYWRCRFVNDRLTTEMIMSGLSEAKSLKFRTLK